MADERQTMIDSGENQLLQNLKITIPSNQGNNNQQNDDTQNQQDDQQQQQNQNDDDQNQQDDGNQQDDQQQNQNDQQNNDQNQDDADLDVIDLVVKKYQLDSTKGYSNDTDGLITAIEDTVNTRVPEVAQQMVNNLFAQYPDLAEFYEHTVVKGLSPQLYKESKTQPDEVGIDITKEEGQEQILRSYYSKRNLGKDEIDAIIDKKKNNGSLEDTAKNIQKEVVKQHKEQIKLKEQEELKAQQEYEESIKKNRQETEQLVNKGKIKGFIIPNNEINEFKKALFIPDEKGMNIIQKLYSEMSREDKLAIDYIIFKKFNVNGLQVKTKDLNSLKNNKQGNQQQRNNNQNQSNFTYGKIDFTKVKTSQ